MPAKTFDCPHCETPVPAKLEDLESAAAVIDCPSCHRPVYLTMGKLSNFQPGGEADYKASYDSGD